MRPPLRQLSEIKIAHLKVKVQEEDELDEAWGIYQRGSKQIKMEKDFPNSEHRKEVLLHEVLHAILDIYRIETKDEETLVSQMAVAMMQVMNDNPKLRKYLYE